MTRLKFIGIALLSIGIFFCGCRTSSKHGFYSIPFSNIEYELVSGKVNDSIICFNKNEGKSFRVKFIQKKFRRADGSFAITGLSQDSNSLFHTRTPYVGFFDLEINQDSAISLRWFSNISWTMDFNKHEMGRTIALLFRFKGKFDCTNENLVFYKTGYNSMTRDTIIYMKHYK